MNIDSYIYICGLLFSWYKTKQINIVRESKKQFWGEQVCQEVTKTLFASPLTALSVLLALTGGLCIILHIINMAQDRMARCGCMRVCHFAFLFQTYSASN